MNTVAADWIVGRYAIYDEIASGGMAIVYYGRLLGPEGFSRPVAIKRLHPHLAKEADFARMLLDEARLAAHIQHPNVVQTLDVVTTGSDGIYIVMQYVQGETVAGLQRCARERGTRIPLRVSASIMVGVLDGLHAAHEATDERGQRLGIVHRDVSPQNVIVGLDGVARLLDFGVAKAAGRGQSTQDGQLKGKLSYMAPEQVRGLPVDRRTDIYAASVVFWEMLAGRRLFDGTNGAMILQRVLHDPVARLGLEAPDVPPALESILLCGIAREPSHRFPTAREMAREIERVVAAAGPAEVGEWVEAVAGTELVARARRLAEVESQRVPRVGGPRPVDAREVTLDVSLPEATTAAFRQEPAPAWPSAPPPPPAGTTLVTSEFTALARPRRGPWVAVGALAIVGALAATALVVRIALVARAHPAAPAGSPTPDPPRVAPALDSPPPTQSGAEPAPVRPSASPPPRGTWPPVSPPAGAAAATTTPVAPAVRPPPAPSPVGSTPRLYNHM